MPRSSDSRNIFHDPDPTHKPWFVAKVPSRTDGRSLLVSYGYTPEGKEKVVTEDVGSIREDSDPFFYLTIFGGTMAMSQRDLSECVDEMQYTRQKKRAELAPVISNKELVNKVGDLIESVQDAKVGRKRFGYGSA